MIETIEFDRPVTTVEGCRLYGRYCDLFDRGYRYVAGSQRGDERAAYFLMAIHAAKRITSSSDDVSTPART